MSEAESSNLAVRARAAHTRVMVHHAAQQTADLRAEFHKLLSDLSGEELPKAVWQIAREFGADPGPILAALDSDEPIIVRRDQAPGGFGLDNLDACYQQACDAAGGEWVDDATVRGCKARPGLTAAEWAASLLAYHINAMECLARAGGGVLGKIWDIITD